MKSHSILSFLVLFSATIMLSSANDQVQSGRGGFGVDDDGSDNHSDDQFRTDGWFNNGDDLFTNSPGNGERSYSDDCDTTRRGAIIKASDCFAALKSYDNKGSGVISFSAMFNQKSCSTCQIEIRSSEKRGVYIRYQEALRALENFTSRCRYTTGRFHVPRYPDIVMAIDKGSGRYCPRYQEFTT